MPAKRRVLDRNRHPQISPEAVRLFRVCRSIEDAGGVDGWEDDRRPGRRREYLDAEKALATACGRSWVDFGPLDCTSEAAPDYIRRAGRGVEWRRGWELRQALLAADAADREASA